jgi:uncharacterized protein YdgA (DUF945 family)
MKRAALGALVAATAVAVLVAAPGLIGFMAENRLTGWLRTLSQQGAYRIELVDFRRGWFDSTARARLVVVGPYAEALREALGTAPGTVFEVVFDMAIDHGPALLRDGRPTVGFAYAETDMRLPAPVERMLGEYLRGEPLIRFRTTFGLLGGSRTLIANPDYKGTMGPEASVQWDGASGKIVVGRRAFSVHLAMPLFQLEAGDRLVVIRGVTLDADQKRWGRHLWLGDTTIRGQEIQFVTPGALGAVRIDGLLYQVTATPKDDRLDAHLSLGVAAADVAGGSIGPSAWTLDVRNLSATALDEAYGLYNAFLDAADADSQRAVLNRFLGQSLIGLFKSPVELETAVALRVDGPYAVYDGRTSLKVSGRDADVTVMLDQTVDALDWSGVRLSGGTARLRLAHLDGKALGDLYGEFVRIVATALPEAEQELEMQQAAARLGPAVLRPETRLHLENVALHLPEGKATAGGELGFAAAEPAGPPSASTLIRRLQGSLEARIARNALLAVLSAQAAAELRAEADAAGRTLSDDALRRLAARLAERQVRAMERDALLRRDGGDYALSVTVADGRVTLNGVPRPDLAP